MMVLTLFFNCSLLSVCIIELLAAGWRLGHMQPEQPLKSPWRAPQEDFCPSGGVWFGDKYALCEKAVIFKNPTKTKVEARGRGSLKIIQLSKLSSLVRHSGSSPALTISVI